MNKKPESLSDLEKRGEELIAEANKPIPEQFNKTRMTFNTSSFYNLLLPGYVTMIMVAFAYFISAWLFYPYLMYFVQGGPIASTPGSKLDIYDPTQSGYALMYPFIIINALLIIYGILVLIGMSKRTSILNNELAWFNSLPFKITNLYQVLGRKRQNAYTVKVYYENNKNRPDEKRVKNILTALETEVTGISPSNVQSIWNGVRLYRRPHADYDELTFRFRAVDVRGPYWFYKLFHLIVDKMFVELHEEYKIDRMEVS